MLLHNHPNPAFVSFLTHGFCFGFDVGYRGPRSPRLASNLRSALARPTVIQDYRALECEAGHTASPFTSPPLPNFVVNPLGGVPKKHSSKWRLIMHPHPLGSSINDGVNICHFLLRYSMVQDAMDSVMLLGRGAPMAKLDIKSAFRLCPLRPKEHHQLGMRWQGDFLL